MAILQTCCGCVPIESGTMFVGIFSFVTYAMMFIGALPSLTNPPIRRRPSDLSSGGDKGIGGGGDFDIHGVGASAHSPLSFDDTLQKMILGMEIERRQKEAVAAGDDAKSGEAGGIDNGRVSSEALGHVRSTVQTIRVLVTVLITVNMIAALVLILGVKHRNRYLLLPWIFWTGLTLYLCMVWIGLTMTPVLVGDLAMIVLFAWGELCVVSHYQNLRDGVRDEPPFPLAGDVGSLDAIYVATIGVGGAHGEGGRLGGRRRSRSRLRSTTGREDDLPPAYPGIVSDPQQQQQQTGSVQATSDADDKDGDERMSPPPSYDQCYPEGGGDADAIAAATTAESGASEETTAQIETDANANVATEAAPSAEVEAPNVGESRGQEDRAETASPVAAESAAATETRAEAEPVGEIQSENAGGRRRSQTGASNTEE